MSAEGSIELDGTVVETLPGNLFRVLLSNKHEVLAHISGKMRKRIVGLTTGDRVRMQMTPFDMTIGRITCRLQE